MCAVPELKTPAPAKPILAKPILLAKTTKLLGQQPVFVMYAFASSGERVRMYVAVGTCMREHIEREHRERERERERERGYIYISIHTYM
jgi:hypothetical protein